MEKDLGEETDRQGQTARISRKKQQLIVRKNVKLKVKIEPGKKVSQRVGVPTLQLLSLLRQELNWLGGDFLPRK